MKCHLYGLKKNKNARKNCFRFSEIVKITIKIDSSLSNITIGCLLKMPTPEIHREFSDNYLKI